MVATTMIYFHRTWSVFLGGGYLWRRPHNSGVCLVVVLPSPCCELLNIWTPQCSHLERNFGLMISRFSGTHGMVYAHEDGSFLFFIFTVLVSTSQRMQTSNQKHVGGGMLQWSRIRFSKGMSFRSYTLRTLCMCVLLGVCTHKPYALRLVCLTSVLWYNKFPPRSEFLKRGIYFISL